MPSLRWAHNEADWHVEQAAESVVFRHLLFGAAKADHPRPTILPTRNVSYILLPVLGFRHVPDRSAFASRLSRGEKS